MAHGRLRLTVSGSFPQPEAWCHPTNLWPLAVPSCLGLGAALAPEAPKPERNQPNISYSGENRCYSNSVQG